MKRRNLKDICWLHKNSTKILIGVKKWVKLTASDEINKIIKYINNKPTIVESKQKYWLLIPILLLIYT